MHFSDRHILRSSARPLVRLLRGKAGDVMSCIIRIAFTAGSYHGGRHLDRARLVESLQRIRRAQDRRRAAITDRRAHRQGQWPRNTARRQNFVDGKGRTKLRKFVVHRMPMILCGNGGHLALRSPVQFHVMLGNRSVDVHEDAPRAVFNPSFGRHLEPVRQGK